MPRPLTPHGCAPAVGDVVVIRAGTQRRAQVGFLTGEQAIAHLPIRGEPYAITIAAERPGDRCDHANRLRAAVNEEPLGRCTPTLLYRRIQPEVDPQGFEDLLRSDHG